jgi:hypothetical protein
MGFALLNYNVAAATAGASNVDLSAATDPDFTQQSSHYIFTERYFIRALLPVGASITRGRIQMPHINALVEAQIYSANRSLQPPANPQFDDYFNMPLELPQNEQLQIQLSNNLGAATEIENCAVIITGDDWTANLPGALPFGNLIVRASFTVTPTLNAWSGPQALTFSQALRGGRWAVVGATCQGSNSAFFRLIFPKYNLYKGIRKLRPGWFIQNAIGDQLSSQLGTAWVNKLGVWGVFDTFEPLTCEVFGTAANSTTYQLFLWLKYISETTGQGQPIGAAS